MTGALYHFKQKGALLLVVRTVWRPWSEFMCQTCGTEFKRKDNLTRHKRSHEGNLHLYKCHFCFRGFIRKDARKRHENTCRRRSQLEE